MITSSLLLAADKTPIPMLYESLSVENSGAKSAIDAYQDGVGIYTLETLGANKIDNSEMNFIIFKYGQEAKNLNVSIKDYVLENGTDLEKELASTVGKFEPMIPGNGSICNDNNSLTINDIYTNGVCAGINIVGTTCNDNNVQTINDKYDSNGVCVGNNVEGQSCDDNNSFTTNDIYTNGICAGKLYVSAEMYSDGSKANTCYEYYNGSNGKLASTATGYYQLNDGRRAYCNMPALVKIKQNNDWSGLVAFSSGLCYANGSNNVQALINYGTSATIFPHPTNNAAYWCEAKINSNNMFKTITIKPIHTSTLGDGILWDIHGTGITTISGTLYPNTNAGNKVLSGSGIIYLKTNSRTNDNGNDHSQFYITGYVE